MKDGHRVSIQGLCNINIIGPTPVFIWDPLPFALPEIWLGSLVHLQAGPSLGYLETQGRAWADLQKESWKFRICVSGFGHRHVPSSKLSSSCCERAGPDDCFHLRISAVPYTLTLGNKRAYGCSGLHTTLGLSWDMVYGVQFYGSCDRPPFGFQASLGA